MQGFASIVLKINEPPTGGVCSLEPRDVLFGDKCNVQCSGWRDSDGIQEAYELFGELYDSREGQGYYMRQVPWTPSYAI